MSSAKPIRVIDSHTAGEPTRVVVSGGPDLGHGPLSERLELFRREHDHFRSAVVNEPRGSDVVVGALLCPPTDSTCVTGVIFFNNVGYLGMCGHGTIGVVETLRHLGLVSLGSHKIETPVGTVVATLNQDQTVSVENVESYRKAKAVTLDVVDYGRVTGDVAWSGNWFFLVENCSIPLDLSRVEELTNCAWAIRQAVNSQGYPEVDHVELFGPGVAPGSHSRNFVLCPGRAYDRSPCGTGTSAKLACLAEDGKLKEGEEWIQESIIGSEFRASYKRQGKVIIPTVTGRAFVNADSTQILDPADPFCWGIRA